MQWMTAQRDYIYVSCQWMHQAADYIDAKHLFCWRWYKPYKPLNGETLGLPYQNLSVEKHSINKWMESISTNTTAKYLSFWQCLVSVIYFVYSRYAEHVVCMRDFCTVCEVQSFKDYLLT